MRRQLVPAISVLLLLTVLTGIAYPLAVLGIGQTAFRHKANGSIIERDGQAVGSALLGQSFSAPNYFHPRPSAAGTDGYDTLASAPSNLGPSNEKLLAEAVPERLTAYRTENGLADSAPVPVDAVTASGSGLDPHISVANARLQAPRVASARGAGIDRVNQLIDQHTAGRALGVLGEPGVHVLELNLALDRGEG